MQTTAPDLRQILVFIWTKILALDRSCQLDLVKDGGHQYFVRFLDSPAVPAEERAMAAFVLATITNDHVKGQAVVASSGLMPICLAHLPAAASPAGSPLFARWLCLCLGKLWDNFRGLQAEAFRGGAAEGVAPLLAHPTPDARAAAVYALGALIYVSPWGSADGSGNNTAAEGPGGGGGGADVWGNAGEAEGFDDRERAAAERTVACHILPGVTDASPLVRVETAVALGRLAYAHSTFFQSAALWWRKHGGGRVGAGGGGEASTSFSSRAGDDEGGGGSAVGSYEGSSSYGTYGRPTAGAQTQDGAHTQAVPGPGVYAVSQQGTYEPAFGSLAPGYRSPVS